MSAWEKEGNALETKVFSFLQNGGSFNQLALEIFRFQYQHNLVYQEFVKRIGKTPDQVKSLEQVPFLPISFFKTKEIKTGNWLAETYFLSSGTSGQSRSRHLIKSLNWYHKVSLFLFERQFGNLNSYIILAMLPTYLENPHSSLISMVNNLGNFSSEKVCFLGLDFKKLKNQLQKATDSGKKLLLFTVSYALGKLAEESPLDLSDCLFIETGGMKGLGPDLPKEALLEKFRKTLKIKHLFSEYGMTELQSQAYAKPLLFHSQDSSLRVLQRQMEDPFHVQTQGRGLANIIDLANIFTCSFIATDDLVEVRPSGEFKILGRAQGAELRGCNLLFAG
jgi:hypothetical protein